MSATQVLFDGAARAAHLVPLLFAPLLVPAAHAADSAVTLPRVVITAPQPPTAAAPAVMLETTARSSALTLAASHVDLRVIGSQARLRTTTVWRNDGPQPITARWTQGRAVDPLASLEAVDDEGCGDPVDELLAALDDETIETGEFVRAEGGERLLAPGDELAVEVEQPADLLVRGDHRRLVLPLLTQRFGAFTPQFTARVTVDAEQPIVALASATHAGEVLRLSDTQVQFVVPAGRVHEGQFFALEYALGDVAPPSPLAQLAPLTHGHAASAGLLAWGGESRARR